MPCFSGRLTPRIKNAVDKANTSLGSSTVNSNCPTENGQMRRSTGTSDRVDAETWAADYLAKGKIVSRERVRLVDVADGFYAWPDGAYATDRKAAGKRISERQCREKRHAIDLHVLPEFGDQRLTEISKGKIRELRNALFSSGLSGGTINKTLFALRAILEYTAEQSLLQSIPQVELAADRQKRRGILTPEEVAVLSALTWADKRCYVANLLAAGSGLRAGEVIGVRHSCVHPQYIEVTHSWSVRGLKSTKPATSRNRLDEQNGESQRSRACHRVGMHQAFLYTSARGERTVIKSDNRLIFESRRFGAAACRNCRLSQEFITPYTPELNGIMNGGGLKSGLIARCVREWPSER